MALLHTLITLWRDEEAASAVEYSLLAALICAIAAAGATTLSDELGELWHRSSDTLAQAIQAGLN